MNIKGGSLYLFQKNRTKFRKDGVNWKKKKGGKVVRENHERLKVGGVPTIKCFYTHSSGTVIFIGNAEFCCHSQYHR